MFARVNSSSSIGDEPLLLLAREEVSY